MWEHSNEFTVTKRRGIFLNDSYFPCSSCCDVKLLTEYIYMSDHHDLRLFSVTLLQIIKKCVFCGCEWM